MGKWWSQGSNPGGLIQEPEHEHLAGGGDSDGVKATDSRQCLSLSPGLPGGCRDAREQLAGITAHLPSAISIALDQQNEVAACCFLPLNLGARILGYTVENEGLGKPQSGLQFYMMTGKGQKSCILLKQPWFSEQGSKMQSPVGNFGQGPRALGVHTALSLDIFRGRYLGEPNPGSAFFLSLMVCRAHFHPASPALSLTPPHPLTHSLTHSDDPQVILKEDRTQFHAHILLPSL